MNRLPLLIAAALAPLSACSSDEDARGPFGPIDPGHQQPAVVQRVDLRDELGIADADPIGVVRDGARTLVFDRAAGLHELGQGPVLARLPDPGVEVRLPFTDLAHLGGDRFAVTAIGDGFLLDAAAQTMQLHFCYEPGFQEEWQDLEQRTDAVTYDDGQDTIYAQPQTYQISNGARTASSIASYDGLTGTLLAWHELDPAFTAGGLAVTGGGLLLGSGHGLYHYDLLGEGGLTERLDLARYGIENVSGLALDQASLFVVDADTDQLVELDRTQLGL